MNTLHIISSLEIGGAQKLLSDLLPVLRDIGEPVDLLVYRREYNALEKKLEDAGIRIISLDIDNFRSPEVIPALRKAIKPYSKIHVHLFPCLYQVALASVGRHKKLFYTEHSTSNRRRQIRLMKSVERYIYGRYRKIVAISDATREALVKWLGKKFEGKAVTILNGIDLDLFAKAAPSPQFPSHRYVLMVSRFAEMKDQDTLIHAIPHVKDQRLLFFFAGDGPRLEHCRQLAARLKVDKRCVFLGARDDIPELIAGSTLGVQSSKWEGFGLTAVEFMAAGKPVIASDVPGLRDIVGDPSRLFPVGDHKRLAALIDATLADTSRPLPDLTPFDIRRMATAYAAL